MALRTSGYSGYTGTTGTRIMGSASAQPARVANTTASTQYLGSSGISAARSVTQAMPFSGRTGAIRTASPTLSTGAVRATSPSLSYGTGFAASSPISPTNRAVRVSGGTMTGGYRSPALSTNLSASAKVVSAAPTYTGGTRSLNMSVAPTYSGGTRSFNTSTSFNSPTTYIGGTRSFNASAAPVTMYAGGMPTYQQSRILPAQTYQSAQSGILPTQGTVDAFNKKHANDDKLNNFKEVKKASGLKKVPVAAAARAFKKAALENGGALTRDQFFAAHSVLLQDCGVDQPPDDVKDAVYDLFDRDDDGVVDHMELVCGITLLCQGSEEDKTKAVFDMFDENGDGFVSMDEMFKFLTAVFKVVLTPNVQAHVASQGVEVEGAEDLASATVLECFQTADLNNDGKLSYAEFTKWFTTPSEDPSAVFHPVAQMLHG